MTDWKARKRGGVLDFRQPGDAADIPSDVFRARICEYLRQVRPDPSRVKTPALPRDKPKRRQKAPEAASPPAQGDWWRE